MRIVILIKQKVPVNPINHVSHPIFENQTFERQEKSEPGKFPSARPVVKCGYPYLGRGENASQLFNEETRLVNIQHNRIKGQDRAIRGAQVFELNNHQTGDTSAPQVKCLGECAG